MFSNRVKIALRNLIKRKTNSFFSLLGLSIGMGAGILIFQYIVYERSFDAFNKNHKQIFRIALTSYQAGVLTEQSATSYPAIGPAAKRSIPEVHDFTRLFKQPGVLITGEKKFREENGYLADASATTTFDLKLTSGDRNALKEPKSILFSEALSEKYFGTRDGVGKTVEFERETYVVRGIFENYPANAHLKIDYLVSYPDNELMQQSWRWRNFYTYLVTSPATDRSVLQQKLNQLMVSNSGSYYQQENRKDEVTLQPLTDIHLHSHLDKEADANGSASSLRFLFIVGILVLVISWVNYINLMVADATSRYKEIGVRKILGSSMKQLTGQFFTESLLFNAFAVLLAVLAIRLVNPWFSDTSGMPAGVSGWNVEKFVLLVLPITVTGLLITGLYPAILVSRFQSVNLVKGLISFSSKPFSFRQSFLIVQFFLTTALISGVLVVYRQLNYMTSKKPGFNTEQIVVVRGFEGADTLRPEQAFIHELSNTRYIKGISNSSFVPGQEISRIRGIKRKETSAEATYRIANTTIDYNFVDLYGLKLLAGRNFSALFPSDNKAVLLNEEAVRLLGFKNASEAINQEIINGDRNPDTLRIAGVLENFHQRSVQFAITPTVFLLGSDGGGFYSIRVNTEDLNTAINAIENTHQKYLAASPFDFFFLDDHFNRQYLKDKQFASLFSMFTALAILISCLGLFAMIKFISTQRIKEIGIRKVLGASVINILSLLTKDFLKPVVMAILISTPASWFIMNEWLQNYASRITLSPDLFVLGAVVSVLISLATISTQAMKSAFINPVKNLRTE